MECGREPGGEHAGQLGVCRAAIAEEYHGANGGQMAGRFCWAVCGTLCGGEVQGTNAKKFLNCRLCPFFDLVCHEQGGGLILSERDWPGAG
ncbi:MAG: hypothetical protein H8E31_04905 [Planctomycetes bacterium]|nr:hypothetical protein [Planctomycetota bacterium]